MVHKAIIPAIDISNGRCVRLEQGKYDTRVDYSDEPAERAREYADYGARILHVVDLDACMNRSTNRDVIEEICKAVPHCIVEVGGGIHTKTDVQQLCNIGVKRLVLGSVLLSDFFEAVSWIDNFDCVFVATLDILENKMQLAGWTEASNINYNNYIKVINQNKFKGLNFTDVSNDGTMQGINLELANTVAEKSKIPVIIAGGIGSLEHIEEIMEQGHKHIKGLIIGKAIYENKINIKEILKRYPPSEVSLSEL